METYALVIAIVGLLAAFIAAAMILIYMGLSCCECCMKRNHDKREERASEMRVAVAAEIEDREKTRAEMYGEV